MQAEYLLLAGSVMQTTFPLNCTCLLIAITGNTVESEIVTAAAQLYPIFIFKLGPAPPVSSDGIVLVTDSAKDIHTVSGQYSKLLVFYTGDSPLTYFDRTLSMLVVTQQGTTFFIMEPLSGTLLGQWDPDTGLTKNYNSPWMDIAVETQLKRIPGPKLALFECPPYVTYEYRDINGKNVTIYDGIEVRIVRESLKKFEITFMSEDLPEHENSTTDPWIRVIEDVAEHDADVAVCSIWLTNNPPEGVQLSSPWTRQKGTFLVPKPHTLPQALILYLPFNTWLWVTLLNTVFAVTLILHITARLLPFPNRSQYQNLRICLLDTFRILMLTSAPRFPREAVLRYLLASWAFFSLLTMTIYLTRYTSLLASPIYSKPIDTVEDLVQQGIYWGEQKSDLSNLFVGSENPKLEEFRRRFKQEESNSDREKRILQGKYAIFTKVLSSTFVTETEILSDRARRELKVMKEAIFKFHVAIALRPNSPFKTHIDKTITWLNDAGITTHWQNHVILKLGYHYMETFFQAHLDKSDLAPLSLSSVQGAFSILGTGLVLSSVVWILENIRYTCS